MPRKLFGDTQKLLLSIVVLPLALACAGAWQMARSPSGGGLARWQAAIDREIDNIQDCVRRNGGAVDSLCSVSAGKDSSGNEQSYGPYLAIEYLSRARDSPWRAFQALAPWYLAAGGLIAALLAAAIGGSGLWRIRAMGRKAMTSRDALLRAFTAGRKWLPWLVAGVGFFLLMALAACSSFELVNWMRHGADGSRADAKLEVLSWGLILMLVLMAFRLVWSTYRSSRRPFVPEPLEVLGLRIGRGEAPALWAFAREVAGKARVAMPDHIVAGLDRCFFVTENAVRLRGGERLPPGRTLYLPMPYMAFMEHAEAAAVVGHELAHFSGADTQYSLQFASIYAGAVDHLRALGGVARGGQGGWHWMVRPTGLLIEFFLDTFDRAVKHWSRERELIADRAGASASDTRAIGLSLLRIGVLAPHVAAVLERQGGKDAQGGILGQVIARVREKGLDDPRAHLDDQQPHPTDTHPTTRQRLAALRIPEDAALFADAARTRCSVLLVELGLASAEDLDGKSAAR